VAKASNIKQGISYYEIVLNLINVINERSQYLLGLSMMGNVGGSSKKTTKNVDQN